MLALVCFKEKQGFIIGVNFWKIISFAFSWTRLLKCLFEHDDQGWLVIVLTAKPKQIWIKKIYELIIRNIRLLGHFLIGLRIEGYPPV